MAKTPTMNQGTPESFEACLLQFREKMKQTQASFNNVQVWLDFYADTNRFDRAAWPIERILLQHHKKAFIAWLKLQQ